MPPIRVLIVDDNPAFSRAARNFLTSQPRLEVVGCATSAAEALELVAVLKPDLILMDVVMPPGMNGIEATRQIKRDVGAPKIIVLTLHKGAEYGAGAAAAGADGFIQKDNLVADLPSLISALFRPGEQMDAPEE